MNSYREMLRVGYLNLSFLCVLLVGMEIGGQTIFFLVKGYPVFEQERHVISETSDNPFEVHPFMAGRLKGEVHVAQNGKAITSTALHTRWTGATERNTDSIEVALLGGSTTFGSGVTDTDTWPARLQALLGPGYSVTNYGVPGYSSAESIIQLALVVPERRPDVIVFFEGWNDLHNYHDPQLGPDYYSHGLKQYSNLAIERPRPKELTEKLADISAIWHFARVVSRRLTPRDTSNEIPTNDAYPTPDRIAEPVPDPFVDRQYLRNLSTQKALSQHMGAFAFFVPQVLDASRLKGQSGSAWTPHVRNDAMPRLMNHLNDFMYRVCAPNEAGCAVLSDVTKHPWQPADFIDEGHFSTSGNIAFAALIAMHIRELGTPSAVRNLSATRSQPAAGEHGVNQRN